MTTPHPLATVLAAAAAGRFPAADGATDLTAPDAAGTRAAVAFSGHAYVLADVDPAELSARLAAADGAGGGFGGVHHPTVLSLLADAGGRVAHGHGGRRPRGAAAVATTRWRRRRSCAVTTSPTIHGSPAPSPTGASVAVLADDVGLASIGRGLVDRCEVSVELFDPESAPPGAGRRLLAGALRALPADEPVWAQVAAGNARSLRAFLAAGFVPVASEVLLCTSGDRAAG